MKRQLCLNNIKLDKTQFGSINNVLASKEALIINNNIQDKLKKEKKGYYEIYYDLVKAYDTVNHKWLLKVLNMYKINNKIINIIENIINKWKINIGYNNNIISKIKLKNWILHGDTMSPFLFVLALDPIMKRIDEEIEGVEINKNNKLKN